MKKLILLLSLVTFLIAAENNRAVRAVEQGFQNWGIGGGLSLVVPENGAQRYFANQGIGPGLEVKGAVRFSIGKIGEIHYTPSVNSWFRYDSWGEESNNTDVTIYDWELNINLFDARYVPPMPSNVPIKPYVGFGLIEFSIYTFEEEIGGAYYWGEPYPGWPYDDWAYYYNKDTDFHIGQNLFVGAEFTLDNGFWPYVEFKLSNGNVNEFIMTAGFTIQARK